VLLAAWTIVHPVQLDNSRAHKTIEAVWFHIAMWFQVIWCGGGYFVAACICSGFRLIITREFVRASGGSCGWEVCQAWEVAERTSGSS